MGRTFLCQFQGLADALQVIITELPVAAAAPHHEVLVEGDPNTQLDFASAMTTMLIRGTVVNQHHNRRWPEFKVKPDESLTTQQRW